MGRPVNKNLKMTTKKTLYLRFDGRSGTSSLEKIITSFEFLSTRTLFSAAVEFPFTCDFAAGFTASVRTINLQGTKARLVQSFPLSRSSFKVKRCVNSLQQFVKLRSTTLVTSTLRGTSFTLIIIVIIVVIFRIILFSF